MNKLLLILVTLINVSSLLVMEHDIQPFPMTLSQLYYHFSHDLELLPEITQHIFSLQCGDANLAEIEQNSKSPELLIKYIRRLISSCGDMLAMEICKCFFKHNKISLCDIQNEYKKTCLHYSNNPKVTQLLLKIAGNDAYKLLTIQTNAGWTALYYAAYNNNIEMIKFLLDTAGDKAYELITIQTDLGETTLHSAVFGDHIEMVKLLLNAVGNKAQDLIMIQNNEKQTVLNWDSNLPEINEILQSHMTKNKTT